MARHIDRPASLVEPEWRSALNDAAWLHDIGYGPELARTGFHPLDAARWLRDHHWPDATCRLVAWHTEALEEARLYGLYEELVAEFVPPPPLATAALAWADLTSSPTGERWDAERRLANILDRYPPGSIVHEATRASLPALRAAVREIEEPRWPAMTRYPCLNKREACYTQRVVDSSASGLSAPWRFNSFERDATVTPPLAIEGSGTN